MKSSWYFEGDIMFSTGNGSLFSDKTYTTVVFMSFIVSSFIFGVCFSNFIYFSFVFNKKFQADVRFLSMLSIFIIISSNYNDNVNSNFFIKK